MSDDEGLLEEVARKHGMTPEQYTKVQRTRGWNARKMDAYVQGVGWATGQAGTEDEFVADEVDKEMKERKAKRKAKQENIEGWLRVQDQEQGRDFFLKVMVDTGATVNAITQGLIIDHQLESRITKLEEPRELDLAVGSFLCDEIISIPWVGQGNQRYDTAKFYILPRGRANITDRAILSKEWRKQEQKDLLYDEDERDSLKPLKAGRESASEKAIKEQRRQEARNDQASSAQAKSAYQNRGGGKDSSPKGSSGLKKAGK